MEYQAREVTQTEVDELATAATHFIAVARLYVQQAEFILGAEVIG
jgi:hypothetical protein